MSIVVNGFLTGLLLQIAIGPVFFFILNVSLQRTLADGLSAVVAVTIADYVYIGLAILGVGRLLEEKRIKRVLTVVSSLVLVVFGALMVASLARTPMGHSLSRATSNYLSSFLSAFFLTISSPLTIVFWTSVFAARAIEKSYTRNQLILFGVGAGLATFVFLGSSATVLSFAKTAIPLVIVRLLNAAVGCLLIAYGILRMAKVARGFSREETRRADRLHQ
ncbi:MAG TPA: LysE family transporter [Spirochaetia bacterium]|nr:LysE family transporter [Spirochaetia bacterium]